ncbi:Uncharacterised protein [Mycobacteroides abscessus subsp. abscessus]|nr:Uncharacterised protein [Mycobacteroides abscessus subsp. abscessus]
MCVRVHLSALILTYVVVTGVTDVNRGNDTGAITAGLQNGQTPANFGWSANLARARRVRCMALPEMGGWLSRAEGPRHWLTYGQYLDVNIIN